MNSQDYHDEVLLPTMDRLGDKFPRFRSNASVRMMMGIALAESGLEYLRQRGGGPALSFMQVEPATHDDVRRFLLESRNQPERTAVEHASGVDLFQVEIATPTERDHALLTNMAYAIAIARTRLWWVPEPLPDVRDTEGLARYWSVHYNSHARRRDVERFTRLLLEHEREMGR